MQRLVEGFQDAENFRMLEALVEGTSGVSLRLLDFFLCHYSVKHNVQYSLPQDPLPFNVHDEYDQMLTAYGKVLFDCFGRKQRSVLTRGGKTIKTSAGQVRGHETIASIYSTPTHHCPSLAVSHGIVGDREKGDGIRRRAFGGDPARPETAQQEGEAGRRAAKEQGRDPEEGSHRSVVLLASLVAQRQEVQNVFQSEKVKIGLSTVLPDGDACCNRRPAARTRVVPTSQ